MLCWSDGQMHSIYSDETYVKTREDIRRRIEDRKQKQLEERIRKQQQYDLREQLMAEQQRTLLGASPGATTRLLTTGTSNGMMDRLDAEWRHQQVQRLEKAFAMFRHANAIPDHIYQQMQAATSQTYALTLMLRHLELPNFLNFDVSYTFLIDTFVPYYDQLGLFLQDLQGCAIGRASHGQDQGSEIRPQNADATTFLSFSYLWDAIFEMLVLKTSTCFISRATGFDVSRTLHAHNIKSMYNPLVTNGFIDFMLQAYCYRVRLMSSRPAPMNPTNGRTTTTTNRSLATAQPGLEPLEPQNWLRYIKTDRHIQVLHPQLAYDQSDRCDSLLIVEACAIHMYGDSVIRRAIRHFPGNFLLYCGPHLDCFTHETNDIHNYINERFHCIYRFDLPYFSATSKHCLTLLKRWRLRRTSPQTTQPSLTHHLRSHSDTSNLTATPSRSLTDTSCHNTSSSASGTTTTAATTATASAAAATSSSAI